MYRKDTTATDIITEAPWIQAHSMQTPLLRQNKNTIRWSNININAEEHQTPVMLRTPLMTCDTKQKETLLQYFFLGGQLFHRGHLRCWPICHKVGIVYQKTSTKATAHSHVLSFNDVIDVYFNQSIHLYHLSKWPHYKVLQVPRTSRYNHSIYHFLNHESRHYYNYPWITIEWNNFESHFFEQKERKQPTWSTLFLLGELLQSNQHSC